MHLRTVLGTALSMGLAVNAQQINIHGKITDTGGKAVANALVELSRLKRSDTTGPDGAYAFAFAVGVRRDSPGAATGDIALERGRLSLSVAAPARIEVAIFDVKGGLLDRQALDRALPGVYGLDLAGRAYPGNLWLIKASIGNATRTFRYLPMDGGRRAAEAPLGRIAAGPMLAKVAAVVDTLKVSAAGFSPKSVALSSYDTTVNVALDPSASGDDYWGGLKNSPRKSAGCGKPLAVASGTKNITSSGEQREYIIDIPSSYDAGKAYRLFYCSHWIGSTDDAVATGQVSNGGAANWGYYGLKRMATTNNDPAIFIAPQSQGSTWQQKDHALFDDILAYAKANLCIDETRVFATGFSFGGMITYSLLTNHQKVIRAAVGIAPANFNIWLPNPIPRDPIAWMSTTGVNDKTCPWVQQGSSTNGAKYIALGRGKDNGCTVPADIPTTTAGSKTHLCYDFQGCKPGYPVKACTFDGVHQAAPADGGTADNGLTSWIPTESWKFFTQF